MSEKMLFISMIKKLVSALEGAPFPTSNNEELYQIWYEHSRNIADDALELVAKTSGFKTVEEEIVLP